MDGRTFSRGWPDLFKNKPGLFRMEYSKVKEVPYL